MTSITGVVIQSFVTSGIHMPPPLVGLIMSFTEIDYNELLTTMSNIYSDNLSTVVFDTGNKKVFSSDWDYVNNHYPNYINDVIVNYGEMKNINLRTGGNLLLQHDNIKCKCCSQIKNPYNLSLDDKTIVNYWLSRPNTISKYKVKYICLVVELQMMGSVGYAAGAAGAENDTKSSNETLKQIVQAYEQSKMLQKGNNYTIGARNINFRLNITPDEIVIEINICISHSEIFTISIHVDEMIENLVIHYIEFEKFPQKKHYMSRIKVDSDLIHKLICVIRLFDSMSVEMYRLEKWNLIHVVDNIIKIINILKKIMLF